MNIAQELAVSRSGPDQFTSDHLPRNLGNPPPIAYGGYTTAFAVLSAYKTVPNPSYHVYSILGSFHGPTRDDRPVICRVTRTRDTKTFATRRVAVYQKQDDGRQRNCSEMLIDFHILEDEMMRFSAKPSRNYGNDPDDPSVAATGSEIGARMVQKGQIPQATLDLYSKLFAVQEEFFETRSCLEGVSGQSLHGIAKHLKTTQDGLMITDKASAEWARLRQPVNSEAENAAALAFAMDAGLSPLPLALNHQSLLDSNVAACSTLEFAVRIMVPNIQMHKWHLRERTTIAAAVGRSYNEARLWDEEGQLVAVATQSCILRPKKTAAKM